MSHKSQDAGPTDPVDTEVDNQPSNAGTEDQVTTDFSTNVEAEARAADNIGHSFEPQIAAEPSKDELTSLDPRRLVRDFMRASNISVRFDGSLRRRAPSQGDLADTIRANAVTPQSLEDEFVLSEFAVSLKSSVIKRAIRRVLDEEQRARVTALAMPLFQPLAADEHRQAEIAWARLATVFEQDTKLTMAKLKHFIWQVKRKVRKADVTRHMMLIIVGAKQGTGKTQFVDRLVSPWEEAATGPVLISDIVDARSADIFRFPIAKIDDMERVKSDRIGVLKSVITGIKLRRRTLGSMGSTGFAQAVTLVGTANHDIQELVDDDSGHRRFASLTIRGFDGPQGVNPYWDIINEIDFSMLWRSVPADDVAPIEPFLEQLEEEQTAGALKTSLWAWLKQLDVNSKEVTEITSAVGVGASALYDLFVSQTSSLMTQTEFGNRMRRYSGRQGMPFAMKRKTSENNVYPLVFGHGGK